MQRKNKGFTLMEMLVVVAIVSILVSVSIPVFASQLEKAREATCMANRRALKALLVAAYIEDGSAQAVSAVYKKSMASGTEYTCPSGGTITYLLDNYTGVVTMYCSKHDSRGVNDIFALATNNIGDELFKREGGSYMTSVDSNNGGNNNTNNRTGLVKKC